MKSGRVLVRLGYRFLVMCAVVLLTDAHPTNISFDQAFVKFLDDNKYWGGAVAVMKDGKLLIAKGYGTDQDGKEVTQTSKFHLSSIAKSLTGVAVMQLVQVGKISLQDKVFGDSAILKTLKPWRETHVDPRLYDITVDHLLHHSAGWDSTKPPLYDPLFNQQYLKEHDNVPNMAMDLALSPPLLARDIIRYVMSYPLNFTPGTNVAYSNLAYLVLGRVVEAVSDMEYKDFVKRYILEPCGMWNTRLASMNNDQVVVTAEAAGHAGYDSLDPLSVDSALGWYSNIYDLMRFMRCTLETEKILSNKHKKMLLDKPSSSLLQDSWHASGFHTNSRGNIWQDSDKHTDDLILHYNLKLDGDVLHLPDSWVILLHGKNNKKIKHDARNLMSLIDLSKPTENLFLYDLSDLYKHPNWESLTKENIPSYTIKYQVDEHRLVAYANAVQDEDFNIIWLTSYTTNHHTSFLLIGKHIEQPTRSQYDYIVEHGMDHRQLLKRKLQLEESGYNMTELHSYKSQAHNSPISFAAIFRQEAFSPEMQMKYGTGHLPEPYEKLVQMYYEKQFHPISQTVVHHEDDEQFSFIFIRGADEEPIDFKHYYDLSAHRLAKLTAENAKANLHLAYLNSYDISGKFRIAAFFTNVTASSGKLDIDQTQDQVTETLISNLKQGMVLKYMVPYTGEDSHMKLATFYENEQLP